MNFWWITKGIQQQCLWPTSQLVEAKIASLASMELVLCTSVVSYSPCKVIAQTSSSLSKKGLVGNLFDCATSSDQGSGIFVHRKWEGHKIAVENYGYVHSLSLPQTQGANLTWS